MTEMDDSGSGDGSKKGSSSASAQEKASKNKRKHSSKPARECRLDLSSLSLTEFFRNKPSAEKSQIPPSDLESLKASSEPSDWDDPFARQLQELLSNNLRATFKCAIRCFAEFGYNKESSERAVLRTGLYYGHDDPVSDTVFGALALMGIENKFDISISHVVLDLDHLVEYTILEMICVLREVKPYLAVVEAMWLLLIFDLNLSLAAMGGDYSRAFYAKEKVVPRKDGSHFEIPRFKLGDQSYGTILSKLREPYSLEFEVGGVRNFPNSKDYQVYDVKTVGATVETMTQIFGLPEKSGGSRKGRSGTSTRDMLRQKLLHLEKPCKGLCKGSFKSKLSYIRGGSLLDSILNPHFDSSGTSNTKSSSSKTSTGVGSKTSNRSSKIPSAVPVKDTFLVKPEAKISNSDNPLNYYYKDIPYDKSLKKYVPRNERDENILKLVSWILALQREIESWNWWANEKVMQAARRLRLDKAELELLRQEKEQKGNPDKAKQSSKESTEKRISDMESALASAIDNVETANSTVSGLEAENALLKLEMDGSRLEALRSSTTLQEALMREKVALEKARSGDAEKVFLQESSTSVKRESSELRKEVEKAKNRYNQIRGLFEHEEREKEKFILQATTIRKERQRLEALSKTEDDKIRENAEEKLQKYKNDIKTMETEISELRKESETSKIAELKRTTGKSAFTDMFGEGSVRRERECLMCFTKEISVVFLPCKHQVLCTECNKKHENKQMTECPSCRARIARRIIVCYASTTHRDRAK